jgi:dihydroflavonol-4-reductase
MKQQDERAALVTGGGGYVAGWCIVELLRQGHRVRTTVRSLTREAAIRGAVAAQVDAGDRLAFVVADLTKDEGWDRAVEGCAYVLHVASPLGGGAALDRDALVAPALEGTRRVLRAAVRAGVTRVVMTSAAAAARPPLDSNRASDESIWADPGDPQFDNYRLSKMLAERAAWDLMSELGATNRFTTILPGAVFGPVLSKENLGSVGIIQRLLNGRPPVLPRLGFAIVDVRDLAELHVRAMTSADAAGHRFLAAGEFLWMEEIARILKSTLGARAAKVPARLIPNIVFRLVAALAPDLRSLSPLLGKMLPVTAEKARRLLQFAPRPASTTIVDTAASLIG